MGNNSSLKRKSYRAWTWLPGTERRIFKVKAFLKGLRPQTEENEWVRKNLHVPRISKKR